MRIIAGKHRRRKLHVNPGRVTRPITDRVKEGLFEFLRWELEGRRVADVFAGTGTLGLEALSRGAVSTVFIEADHRAHQLLRRNVEMLELESQSLCWRTDVLRCSFRPKGTDHLLPYDIVFFDPPYRMLVDLRPGATLYRSIERLTRPDVTAAEALLLLRTPQNADFELPALWQRERMQGISSMEIHWYRKQTAPAVPDEALEISPPTV